MHVYNPHNNNTKNNNHKANTSHRNRNGFWCRFTLIDLCLLWRGKLQNSTFSYRVETRIRFHQVYRIATAHCMYIHIC